MGVDDAQDEGQQAKDGAMDVDHPLVTGLRVLEAKVLHYQPHQHTLSY